MEVLWKMLNESIQYIVDYTLHDPTYPALIKLLIVMGMMSFLSGIVHFMQSGIITITYTVGFFKWLFGASLEDIKQILHSLSFQRGIASLKRKFSYRFSRHKKRKNNIHKQTQ